MAIGITAAALGLSMNLFDAGTNSLLFTVEASAVRNVVMESRARYIVAMSSNPPTTRPDTMIALRGYLSLCTPATIEANINNAANGSRNSVTTPIERDGVAAAALAAPAMTLAARQQQATTEVTTRVNIEPPRPPTVLLDTRLPGEGNLAQTTIGNVQVALGQPRTGLLGNQGSPTRHAIEEFELGMMARFQDGWAKTGMLATGSVTTDRLLSLGGTGLPAGIKSPFERAFLTNLKTLDGSTPAFSRLDPTQAAIVWTAFGLTGRPPETAAAMWTALRPAILAQRQKEPGVRKDVDYLDAELWDRVKDRVG